MPDEVFTRVNPVFRDRNSDLVADMPTTRRESITIDLTGSAGTVSSIGTIGGTDTVSSMSSVDSMTNSASSRSLVPPLHRSSNRGSLSDVSHRYDYGEGEAALGVHPQSVDAAAVTYQRVI